MSTRDRLQRFYSVYNPEQLGRIDDILDAYRGDEHLLFSDLVSRYGPEPVEPEPVEPPLGSSAHEEAEPRAAGSSNEPSQREGLSRRQSPSPANPAAVGTTASSQWRTVSAEVPSVITADEQTLAAPADQQALEQETSDQFVERSSKGQRHRSSPLVLTEQNREPPPAETFGDLFDRHALPSADVGSPLALASAERNMRRTAPPTTETFTPHASVVYDDVFSPSRRRLSSRFGQLFTDHRAAAAAGSNPTPAAAASTILRSNSDAMVSLTTAAVYRRDPCSAAGDAARRIVDIAWRNASVGNLAALAARQMGVSPVAASASMQRTSDEPSVSHGLSKSPPLIPSALAAMQRTLNIDEMSSYHVLSSRLGKPGAFPPQQFPSESVARRRAGGLYVSSEEEYRKVGHLESQSGSVFNEELQAHLDSMRTTEQQRQAIRLQKLHTSPLVSKLRAAHSPLIREADNKVSMRSSVVKPTVSSGCCDDDGAIDMICVRCGFICKVVPGREHEAQHSHAHPE